MKAFLVNDNNQTEREYANYLAREYASTSKGCIIVFEGFDRIGRQERVMDRIHDDGFYGYGVSRPDNDRVHVCLHPLTMILNADWYEIYLSLAKLDCLFIRTKPIDGLGFDGEDDPSYKYLKRHHDALTKVLREVS